jgi:23S rRNA (cytidine2498-2'-O)-methyltransferase
MTRSFHTCSPGYEEFLAREVCLHGQATVSTGSGWAIVSDGEQNIAGAIPDLCFAHVSLLDPVHTKGESVREIAVQVADYFCKSAAAERFESPWPLVVATAGSGVSAALLKAARSVIVDLIRKRMSRVVRLATDQMPSGQGSSHGLFVYFTGPAQTFVSRDCIRGGQQRMKDDPGAPSRSYLKVEEAYQVLGCQPAKGETVVDLGAAPGGWSYSAAKRGARVFAVDNGPLKAAAADHPLIKHLRADAFTFRPAGDSRADWLFCDMVEDPSRVLDLVAGWLRDRRCRRFVVNLKFGRTDPVKLLSRVTTGKDGLARRCRLMRARHLFHDREEFTVVGEAAGTLGQ